MSEENKYAIIRHGGKQYKVKAGSKIRVEKISAKAGEEFVFSDVLSVMDGGKVSFDTGSKVTAKILADVKDKKAIIFKKKRRKGYTKKQGHRQVRTEVLVQSING